MNRAVPEIAINGRKLSAAEVNRVIAGKALEVKSPARHLSMLQVVYEKYKKPFTHKFVNVTTRNFGAVTGPVKSSRNEENTLNRSFRTPKKSPVHC